MCFANTTRADESNWPQFRGPGGLGIAPDNQTYPAKLDTSHNLLWKTEVPKGHSSPCIWGDKIFITARSSKNLETICINRGNGKIKWRNSVEPEKFEKISIFNSHATPTPVCDGKRVYVYFGSFGLLAYDVDGNELWRKPLEIPNIQYGSAASPILASNMVIISCDPEEGAYILAVDRDTGETIWRQERQATKGWSTPVLWKHADEEELIVRGGQKLISYNLKDGRKHWWLYNIPYGSATTPVYTGDTLFVASHQGQTGDPVNPIELPDFNELLDRYDSDKDGRLIQAEIPGDIVLVYRYGNSTQVKERFSKLDTDHDSAISEAEWNKVEIGTKKIQPRGMDALVAIRKGGKADVSRTHIKWTAHEGIGQIPSPLFYQERIYLVKHGGNVTCYDAKTGDKVYGDKLGPRAFYYASPVAADDKIYFGSLNGTVIVVQAGDKFQILAQNKIRERIYATPALVDGNIYLRTDKNMYAFVNAEDDSSRAALAKHGAKEDSSAKTEDIGAKTLHDAAADGDIEQVASLIAGGADVNKQNNWGWTPLYTAAAVGHIDIVKLLIAKGANVDTPSEQGTTPLFFAVSNNKRDIAKLLIENGADCGTRDKRGVTPLHTTAAQGHIDIAALLIDKGADVNATNNRGGTPMYPAAYFGQKNIVELLLTKGADVNATNSSGSTPLFLACERGNKEVAELLIDKGANIEARDKLGRTTLHIAAKDGQKDFVELPRDKLGRTTLHIAAKDGQKDFVELLIAKGADVNAPNNKGRTPLERAVDGGYTEIAELLRKHGAKE
jgi:ankyrin repeat protein